MKSPDFTYLTGECRIEHWGTSRGPQYLLLFRGTMVASFHGFAYAVRYAEMEFA
jgi:hypothetical protein